MNVANGAIISKAAHDRIVEAALAHADEQGYCDEVEGFLEALNFVIPDSEPVTVTIKVRVQPESRRAVSDLSHRYDWSISHSYADDVEFISAEVTK
jgi:hypothetical protein